MSIPKEPRQMMINMMYLVLTALLALNVSAEILNAFHVVNKGMSVSNAATDRKTDATMADFKAQLAIDKDKTTPWMNKAQDATDIVAKMNKQVTRYMELLVEKSGGWVEVDKTGKEGAHHKDGKWDSDKGRLEDDRNLEAGSVYMYEQKRADSLRKAIIATRNQLLGLLKDEPAAIQTSFSQNLPLQEPSEKMKNPEGEEKSWEEGNFEMVPTIACLTILNKFQNDAKNSQAQLMDYFYNRIYGKTQKVDVFVAKVIAPSSYILQGQDYKADIFVAAYSSSVQPTVYIGGLNGNAKKDPTDKDGKTYLPTAENPVSGSNTLPIEGGMGKFTQKASGQGEQKYSGAVMVPDPTGKPIYYPFEASYTSAAAAAIVSSDNLNIIYAGIPNPFHVSVPGFSSDKVSASVSEGSFTGAKGAYTANMASTMVGKKVTVRVVVDDQGNKKQIGQGQEFVVKRIPDPVAMVAGRFDGTIHTGELKASPGPIATLKDFYFEGVKFAITSYTFVFIAKRQDPFIKQNTGLAWSADAMNKLKDAHPGDFILIKDIRAKGPDGTTRNLNTISLQIN